MILILLSHFLSLVASADYNVLIIYRYSGNMSPSITIAGKAIAIKKAAWPTYEKLEFVVQQPLSILLQGFGDTIPQFELPAGWIWGPDSYAVGADFFYLINGNINMVRHDQYSRLYDQPGRPQFHFSAPLYWINDPNGLVVESYQGEDNVERKRYHLSYQYDPLNLQDSGLLFWGHAVSDDLVHWRHQPALLFPDKVQLTSAFRSGGIFSGGAIQQAGSIVLFYTNHYQTDTLFQESQYVVVGGTATEIISNASKPAGASQDFRDPCVLVNRVTKQYNLFLGSAINGVPSVLQYSSTSLTTGWVYDGTIYQGPNLPSTTIECPNKLYLQDQQSKVVTTILVFSINDIKAHDSYTLYCVGLDQGDGLFQNTSDVRRLDYGGNFYATQVFSQDPDVIDFAHAVTWMQNWDKPKKYLGNSFYSGALTVARKLFLVNSILHQLPADKFTELRTAYVLNTLLTQGTDQYTVPETSDIVITMPIQANFKVVFTFTGADTQSIEISFDASTKQYKMLVTETSTTFLYQSDSLGPVQLFGFEQRILLDRGAIEFFGSYGEITFSERFIQSTTHQDIIMQVTSDADATVQVWMLGRFY